MSEALLEEHQIRGSCKKREGCWLSNRLKCKGEKIPFPLMSKGEKIPLPLMSKGESKKDRGRLENM
jgi:hypothetical protein